MSKEKHTIRDGIIIAVVSTIIIAILSWVFGGILKLIKIILDLAISSIAYIKQGFIYVWDYFQSPVTITWGLLWLLIVFSLFALWKILQPVIHQLIMREKTPKPYKPRLKDYRRDIAFNVVWEWDDIYGAQPNEPAGFCPDCSTRLVYTIEGYPEKTSFLCENCNRKITTLDGDLRFALSTVVRKIESRIKTGEWQHIVTRQHKEKTN